MLKFLKWVLWAAIAASLILVLCGVYIGRLNFGPYFVSGKGKLVESRLIVSGTDSLFKRGWLTLISDAGRKVDCGLLVPAGNDAGRRYPVMILLGGKATGKHAIDYVLNIRKVIVAAPDYPYTLRESYTLGRFVADIPEMRKAALGMVPSIMMLTDYLWQRPDVDTTKLVLLGYSFGAPFVPCVATYDRRAAAAAMVFGGGDLRALIYHNVRRYRGAFVSRLLSLAGGVLLSPLEPLRYAKAISPMPLIMINGSQDEQIPRQYAEKFYLEAGQPKRIVWMESRHVNPRNVDLTERIVAALKVELSRINILTDSN